jgi:hypothetical protein
MIKVTPEIREAARRVLAKHNAAEPHRAEARYREELARVRAWAKELGRVPNETRIREETAREAWRDKDTRRLLEAIISGKRKLIDYNWWKKVHGDVDAKLLDKMAALADPARNPNEHERKVAAAKLAAAKAKRPPGIHPPPPPLNFVFGVRKRKGKMTPPPRPQPSRKLTSVEAASDSVASAPPKPPEAKAPRPEKTDSVAPSKTPNAQRTLRRAMARANLKCQACGKPLVAQRPTARFCNVTCRSRAWRKSSA